MKVPTVSPVSASRKKSVLSTTELVAWQRACVPPPGSWPKISTLPSQVNDAECPIVTPASARE
jgi:hypothetical protein